MNRVVVFDLEANGFTPDIIHCVSVWEDGVIKTSKSYNFLRKFFEALGPDDLLIGHNIVRYDIPVIEKILGAKINAKVVDTLAMSWYLTPNRVRHGLEYWGEDFNIPKPFVTDWDNQPYEVYKHRCEEDVKINVKVWEQLESKMHIIYNDIEQQYKMLDYLTFKMQCANEQETRGWKLDVSGCTTLLADLDVKLSEALCGLTKAMPTKGIIAKRKPPTKPYKKSGELSATGIKWFNLLESMNLPKDHCTEVMEVTGYTDGNPASHVQVKDWLYSLGWIPQTFKYNKDKDGELKKIPQINLPNGEGICPSIQRLYDREPNLSLLDGLGVVKHRIGILKGFLRDEKQGYLQARIAGLTNTMRFKHAELVNLPGVNKPYGKEIRGLLICPEGYVLMGSDMSSLEDRTKQHYMWDYDPEYVKEMLDDDFDPHLDICILGGMLNKDQCDAHKRGDEDHGAIRHGGKTVNYSCTYGATAETVSRDSGLPLAVATKLVDSYWERNWSIESIANAVVTQSLFGEMWLLNPVSGMWYSLRNEKDKFSTLNQGTGVWCFDTWTQQMIKRGQVPIASFHDEVILCIKEEDIDHASGVLQSALDATNEILNLNRRLDVDIQTGGCYADIH